LMTYQDTSIFWIYPILGFYWLGESKLFALEWLRQGSFVMDPMITIYLYRIATFTGLHIDEKKKWSAALIAVGMALQQLGLPRDDCMQKIMQYYEQIRQTVIVEHTPRVDTVKKSWNSEVHFLAELFLSASEAMNPDVAQMVMEFAAARLSSNRVPSISRKGYEHMPDMFGRIERLCKHSKQISRERTLMGDPLILLSYTPDFGVDDITDTLWHQDDLIVVVTDEVVSCRVTFGLPARYAHSGHPVESLPMQRALSEGVMSRMFFLAEVSGYKWAQSLQGPFWVCGFDKNYDLVSMRMFFLSSDYECCDKCTDEFSPLLIDLETREAKEKYLPRRSDIAEMDRHNVRVMIKDKWTEFPLFLLSGYKLSVKSSKTKFTGDQTDTEEEEDDGEGLVEIPLVNGVYDLSFLIT